MPDLSNSQQARMAAPNPSIDDKQIVCANFVCATTRSIRFRPLEKGNHRVWLCNTCYLCYRLGNFCPHCSQIYRQGDGQNFDGQLWAECVYCVRWSHVACEAKTGNSSPLRKTRAYQNERVVPFACQKCLALSRIEETKTNRQQGHNQLQRARPASEDTLSPNRTKRQKVNNLPPSLLTHSGAPAASSSSGNPKSKLDKPTISPDQQRLWNDGTNHPRLSNAAQIRGVRVYVPVPMSQNQVSTHPSKDIEGSQHEKSIISKEPKKPWTYGRIPNQLDIDRTSNVSAEMARDDPRLIGKLPIKDEVMSKAILTQAKSGEDIDDLSKRYDTSK